MQLLLILSAGCLVARGSEQPDDKRKGRDGWGPGGWETRNGVSSFGWDSRRPISCPRCPQPGEYRGNGYDNLSPEWQRREQSKHWQQGTGVGNSGDGYADKRVWTGSIQPIDNQPGGLVTNWIGGPSRWRDPWEQKDMQYWHSSGGGYAGGYGYAEGSSYGYSQVGDNKPTTYYDKSRGETGYVNHYDRRPSDDAYPSQHGYARGWDYYEQRPGTTYGGGYMYRSPSYPPYDRKNLRDCNPCQQRPPPSETIQPAGGCCGVRYRVPATTSGVPYYGNDWYNRRDYDYSRPAPGYSGRNEGSAGWSTYNRPGDYGGPAEYDYGVTRPSPGSYGKPIQDSSRPWYGTGRPNPDYGRPSSDYNRPVSPDYGISKPDYSRPGSEYGRPNPDYGRPAPDYGRPTPDYGSQRPDYGRPSTVTKPSPAGYGRPSPDYNHPLPPAPDYGRPTVNKPSPGAYGRPSPDLPPPGYNRPQPDYGRPLPDYGRPAPDYGRPPPDYGRPSTDYGRPPVDYGRPSPDYGRPPPDYGRPGPDYGKPDYERPSPGYGRPGCSTCRPDPDSPGPVPPGYPQLDNTYDGYGSSGGYKPSGGNDGYVSGSGYHPAVSGAGSYGAARPDDPSRDDQGGKSPLDRYPGHTGVGATFEFNTDRKQGTYYYDSRPTTSRPSTTTADHSTTQTSKTS